MHICHHQSYWEKKNDNDIDNVTWQCTEYTHYVTEQISDITITANFLNRFRQATAAPARPVRDTDTPNDRPRGPPKSTDDERVDQLREEVRKRFENTCRRKRRMTSHQLLKVNYHQKQIRPRPCQNSKSRRVPQERSALLLHPIQKHPLLELPNHWREMTDASQLKAQHPRERHPLKQKNFSRMQMLPRNFSPSLRKKQKNWNGISVLLVPNGVKKVINVMPQMQCFGATHVALHFA
jgi:hypothetical protein